METRPLSSLLPPPQPWPLSRPQSRPGPQPTSQTRPGHPQQLLIFAFPADAPKSPIKLTTNSTNSHLPTSFIFTSFYFFWKIKTVLWPFFHSFSLSFAIVGFHSWRFHRHNHRLNRQLISLILTFSILSLTIRSTFSSILRLVSNMQFFLFLSFFSYILAGCRFVRNYSSHNGRNFKKSFLSTWNEKKRKKRERKKKKGIHIRGRFNSGQSQSNRSGFKRSKLKCASLNHLRNPAPL